MGGRRDSPAPRGANPAAGVAAPPEDVTARAVVPSTWNVRDQAGAYRELEHPADLLLEITGVDLAGLFENALFAFYDQLARLGDFEANREVLITVEEATPPDLLRALLNEALYRFETEGFVAVGARVTVETGASPEPAEAMGIRAGRDGPQPRGRPEPDSGPGPSGEPKPGGEPGPGRGPEPGRGPGPGGEPEGGRIKAVARLWGEDAPAGRHTPGTEIKAVTYHRLAVERRPDGTYVATVLFDV